MPARSPLVANRRTLRWAALALSLLAVRPRESAAQSSGASGEVRRHAPDGALLATISAGAPLTTSCAFVGPDLDVLLITTEASAPGFELTALSGALFACTPGARGLPTRAWRATPMAPLP